MSLRLKKEDSADIGFGEECLMAGAVTQDEFRTWVIDVIETENSPPIYLFDLLDLKDLREIFKGQNGPIGFLSNSGLTDIESNAIDGIAYKRGLFENIAYDRHISKIEALEALSNNQHIAQKFNEFFPSVSY